MTAVKERFWIAAKETRLHIFRSKNLLKLWEIISIFFLFSHTSDVVLGMKDLLTVWREAI